MSSLAAMEPNRRQHERVRAPRIQVRVASLDRLRALYLEDLSQGGIFIRTEKALAMGAAVEVELVPPESAPLSMSGKVVRIVNDDVAKREKRAGMAIKFEGMNPATEAALTALVARLRQPAPEQRSPVPARPAPPPPGALHDAQERISSLEMELSDLKGQLEAHEQQQRQLEEDEQTARRLAERLAQEKTEAVARAERTVSKANEEVQRLRKEAAAASEAREVDRRRIDELEAGRGRVDELEDQMQELLESQGANEAALDAERREHENTMAELSALRSSGSSARDALDSARGEVVKAKADLEAERARVKSLERALADERAKTEAARAREREVRKLLAMVSDKAAEGEAPPKEEAMAAHPDEPLSVESEMGNLDEEEEAVVGEIAEESTPETEENPFDVPLEENKISEPPPEKKAEPAIGSGLDVDFDIAFQEPGSTDDLSEFTEKLRKAAKIVRTDRYSAHTPTDPTEILVFDLLTRVETLEDLEKWTQGRVTTEKLVEICHDFHVRSLIQLS